MAVERLCRCPACNPIHHKRGKFHHAKALPDCAVCKNTRRVSVEVAERYMSGHNGVSLTQTGRTPNTAQSTPQAPPPSERKDKNWT